MKALNFLNLLLENQFLNSVIALFVLALALGLKRLPSWIAWLAGHLRPHDDPTPPGKQALDWTYRLRHLLVALGVGAGLISLTGLGWTVYSWKSLSGFHWVGLALWSVTFAFVGWSLVGGLAPWFSPSFRGLVLCVAKAFRNSPLSLRDGILGSLLVSIAAILVSKLFPKLDPSGFSENYLLPATACGVALVLLAAVYGVRRRVVVQPFFETRVDKDLEGIGTGLAVRLQHELARIQRLFETVDEVLPERYGDFAPLAVGVEDVGQILKEAVGPDAAVQVGLLKIPYGAILSALGIVLRGPRITGSVQRDAHGFRIFAEMSGGGRSESWQVCASDLAEVEATLAKRDGDEEDGVPAQKEAAKEQKKGPLEDLKEGDRAALNRLVRLLACRIFTSLVPCGTPSWQATYHFSEALRAYRATQRTEKKKPVLLRQAEKSFIRALNEDNKFARCHCNLGVIYRELGLPSAEEASLRRALAEDPDAVDASFGMAILRILERPLSAKRHCLNALRVQPENPQLWNLLSVAQVNAEAPRGEIQPVVGHPAWEENLSGCEIATALAWRDLWRVSWSRRPLLIQKGRSLAALCLSNLATASDKAGDPKRACRLYRQALDLKEDSSWIAFKLGKALYNQGQWKAAVAAFSRVYDDALDEEDLVEFALYLLGAYTLLKQKPSESSIPAARLQQKIGETYDYCLDYLAGLYRLKGPRGGKVRKFFRWLTSVQAPLNSDPTERQAFSRLTVLFKALALFPREDQRDNRERLRTLMTLDWVLFQLKTPKRCTSKDERRERKPRSERAKALVRAFLRVLEVPMGDASNVTKEGCFETYPVKSWRRDHFEDVRWLRAQVLLQLAKSFREDEAAKPAARRKGHTSIERTPLVEAAIDLLPIDRHGLQYRRDGLYLGLAEAFLEAATGPPKVGSDDSGANRRTFLRNAMSYAERAVAWNPQGARELLVLGEVYAGLEDWNQAMDTWEKTLSLEAGHEVWREIATTCFPEKARIKFTKDQQGRLLSFLKQALEYVESETSEGQEDDERVNAHAKLHYCLGQLYSQSGSAQLASTHLKIAKNLGLSVEGKPAKPEPALSAQRRRTQSESLKKNAKPSLGPAFKARLAKLKSAS